MRIVVAALFIAMYPAGAHANLIYEFYEIESNDVLARLTLNELPIRSFRQIDQLEITDDGRTIWTSLPRFYAVHDLLISQGSQVIDDGNRGLTGSPGRTAIGDPVNPPDGLHEFQLVFDYETQKTDAIYTITDPAGELFQRDGHWLIVPEPVGTTGFAIFGLFFACRIRRLQTSAVTGN